MYKVDLRVLLLVACAAASTGPASAARILGVFPAPAKSHATLGKTLMEALASAGHDVTMVSPFPSDEPIENYRDIPLINTKLDLLKSLGKENMFDVLPQSVFGQVVGIHAMGLALTDRVFDSPEFRKLLDSDEHFDAVIVGIFLDEALLALGHRFNAPTIVLSPIAPGFWTNGLVGNPSPYSHVPDMFTAFTDRMTFVERFENAVTSIGVNVFRELHYIPGQDALVRKYFPGSPSLKSLMTDVSLVLVNSHVSLAYPQALVPNMVEIGGFHVRRPKPLPTDLQKLLDDATEGVLYFSMGSNLQSKDLPIEKRNAILAVFGRLKHRVLWKWEAEQMPGKPDNVVLSPWLPQTDILAHPNVKAFITHGGLLSTTESINRGVPLIGIPIFGDQHSNMRRAVSLGYGIMISYDNLTETSLAWALDEILSNPSYRENIGHRSTVLRDQQVDPLNKAVWWIEYIIRHKGAKHLRNSAVEMPLYQYLLIDVVAAIVALVSLVIIVPCYLTIRCCRRKGKTGSASTNGSKEKRS